MEKLKPIAKCVILFIIITVAIYFMGYAFGVNQAHSDYAQMILQ